MRPQFAEERHMRLVFALTAAVSLAVASPVAVASVLAAGEATVTIVTGADEPAREWDIDVAGGTASPNHLTLAPIAVGFGADVTVAISESKAAVTLTAVLPADRQLSSVGCLDDLTPPTEISPKVEASSVAFDVVPGRRYRCFAESQPGVSGDVAGAVANKAIAAPGKRLPRSDTAPMSPGAIAPGWPAVLLTLVVILGLAAVLRPVRRSRQ